MKFSEYRLQKVSSYFTPSEDEGQTDRPVRAYSVGSRPDTIKNRNCNESIINSDSARVRAFSVGSKRKLHTRVLPPHSSHSHHKPKASSVPLLSNGRTTESNCCGADNALNDDLMEMDFSRPAVNTDYMDMNPANNR